MLYNLVKSLGNETPKYLMDSASQFQLYMVLIEAGGS